MTQTPPNTTLTCPNCGTQREAYVRPSTPKAGFCNSKCFAEYRTKPRKYENCIQCGTKLTEKTQTKFCNRSCSATYNNTGRDKSTWISPLKNPRPKCLVCPNLVKSSGRKYCSNKCAGVIASKILRKYKTYEEKREANKKNKLASQIKRESMKRERCTTDENELKEIKEFIDNCPEGHQIDHIIPISKGGWHCIDNLQYLTNRENICKNNKSPCEWTLYRLKMWKLSPNYFETNYVANMQHLQK